jgi:hypothetical protein
VPEANQDEPYSPIQVDAIAEALGRDKGDELVRFVVGIGRTFKGHREQPSPRKTAEIKQEEDHAANLLDRLDKLFQRSPHFREYVLPCVSIRLGRMLESGEIGYATRRLRELADTGKRNRGGRGRRGDNAAITAIMQLEFIWEQARGAQRGKLKFLRAALEPVGYWPINRTTLEGHMRSARGYLRGRKAT